MGYEGSPWYTGPCIDGPIDGKRMSSRYPKGFLYVDKPNSRAWVYEWKNGAFVVQNAAPDVLNIAHMRWTARERFDWDVHTAEEEVSNVNAGTT